MGAFACRKEVTRLDDVQRMAYSAKPAVVRVNAYATAEFHYRGGAINAIAGELGLTQALDDAELSVPTGGGGSGTGFTITADGWVLTSGHVIAPTRDAVKLHQDLLHNGAIAALVKHLPIDELRRLYRENTLDAYVQELISSSRLVHEATVNEVELSNGARHPFRADRYSPALSERGNDLALLQINGLHRPVLSLGDSDAVRVGDSVWAIGYPAVASSTDDVIGGWLSSDSDLEATMTPGTITAIKTNITRTPVFQSNVG
ncbi:MAG TPA: trypsin-like peptidase domain-containing protein, partial [Thermoanaerobaculia bacterium]|nr:trypsin-like peptidase domain-containing protein [Thermoanaerobaculia bacterium]